MLSLTLDPNIPRWDAIAQWEDNEEWYITLDDLHYFSERYGHAITVPKSFVCDGATGVPDIGLAWCWHDFLYYRARWDDGTLVTRYQADMTFRDIMWTQGDRIRSRIRFWGVSALARNAWESHRRSQVRKHNDLNTPHHIHTLQGIWRYQETLELPPPVGSILGRG